MTSCPRCHDVRTVEVAGVAQCEGCGMVFELSTTTLAPDRPDLDVTDFDELPELAQMTVLPHEVLLRLPWRSDANPLTFGIAAVMASWMLGGAWSSQGLISPVLALCASGVAYAALTLLVNRTTIRVGRDTTTIQHGPLPSSARGGAWRTTELARLEVVENRHPNRSNQKGVGYDLRAGRRVLLQKWLRRERLEHVGDVITQVAGPPAR